MTQGFGRRQAVSKQGKKLPLKRASLPQALGSRGVEDELQSWKQERKRYTAPYRYVFGAAMALSVAASFLLPDTPGLLIRTILLGLGLTALTIGRRKWARRDKNE